MIRLAISSILIASLTAVEAETPLLSVVLPDCARTTQRLKAGPLGAIWKLPAVQRLNAQANTASPEATAWNTIMERAAEVRFTLLGRLPEGESEPNLAPFLAVRVPAGIEPKPIDGLVIGRNGDWMTLSSPNNPLPKMPEVSGDPAADLRLEAEVRAIAGLMRPSDRAPVLAMLAVFGLGRITGTATAGGDGVAEDLLLAGARLPLRPVAVTTLAGLPEQTLAVAALGLDGAALARCVHAVFDDTAAAAGHESRWGQTDAILRQDTGVGLDALLRGLDGTVVVAITPGAPFPGFLAAVPATADLDGLVARLLGQEDIAAGQQQVEAARNASIAIPLPPHMPLQIVLRRTASHWLVGSDQLTIETMAGAKPAPFPTERCWPGAQGAVGLVRGDTRAQLQVIAGLLPMAMPWVGIRDPAQRQQILGFQAALQAALPLVPPATAVATVEASGVRVRGRNGVVSAMLPGAVLAGMALPAIAMLRENAQRANAGNNMRQIIMTMIAYQTDNDQKWPQDLAEIVTYAEGDLSPKTLTSPGHPEIAKPFLYVRPVANAKSTQPVLVQDPACNRGKGSMVCYVDGHVAFVTGTALWEEAKRLATMPAAAAEGVAGTDWTTTKP